MYLKHFVKRTLTLKPHLNYKQQLCLQSTKNV